ncbi:MAG: hypothetical protein GX415_00330 [Chloroflexi bacterium]|jgi:hypothetical protein|nr:hypothetical protein [Anaerolineaceae bacterium]NLI43857.1 hypothetical protein [Chloroflexota bacterium]HOE35038.1 hypothetical protein [Anaerolineaceae bacterium]HQK03541.1 hypothetical protein [Anaerolineaceae bacterium]
MDSRISSLIKPTLKTKFHVDFEWWKSQDSNWKVYLQAFLCPEHQKLLADYSYTDQIDLIDSTTGEVTRVDALLYTLTEHCAKQPDFLSGSSALVDSIFKIFLVNGNTPLNALELSALLSKPAETILRTIGTGRVYKGIKPA